MISTDIGIDLGTSNVLIYIRKKGIVLNEPSIVAIEKESKKVVAVGNVAEKMSGRTPGKVRTIRPIKNGVIADLEATEVMLNEFIKSIKTKNLFVRPSVLICCPSKISSVEKEALKEAVIATGAKKVYIEESPKMAAIGAGMKINKPVANMIVDIGGGSTDIAILSLNDIVLSNSIKTAGNTFNEDIIKYIKETYRTLIGEQTAEKIKTTFANIYNPDSSKKLEVKGKDLLTGLPHTITLSQEETKEALRASANKITQAIITILELAPPELSADIVEKGIVLTGGGSLLCGLSPILEDELSVPILIAESPLTSVVEGTGILLEELQKLEVDH